MGCSASCALLKFFSTFLEWAIKFKSGKISVEHYLDDFLLAGNAGTGDCLQLMDRLRIICEDWGVPLAEDKTIGRSFFLTFLGLEIETLEMVIRIPQCKLSEIKEKLESALGRTKITLWDLQSLVGSLNFCSKAIPSVRAFNQRFCDAMCGINRPSHYIKVSSGMKADIKIWLSLLENFNGTCSFGQNIWLSNSQINLFTDSAGNPDLG
jgi:hypothetical protein